MAKFTLTQKISTREREKLLITFFKGLACIKNSREAASVFSDLLSEQELDMLAKRLAIARALLDGKNYQEIVKILKVSMGTIARINAWLQESGEGFRLVVSRVAAEPKRLKRDSFSSLTRFKRSYPQYFWPQLVLERIVAAANKREKEQLQALIQKAKKKTQLLRRLNFLLSPSKQNSNTA